MSWAAASFTGDTAGQGRAGQGRTWPDTGTQTDTQKQRRKVSQADTHRQSQGDRGGRRKGVVNM